MEFPHHYTVQASAEPTGDVILASPAWTRLECSAEGVLDRVERTLRFTGLRLWARLVVPEGTDVDRAKRLLERAEKSCLVTNSLDLSPELECEVVVEP